MADPLRLRLGRLIAGQQVLASSVTARPVDESTAGWHSYGTELDRAWSEMYQIQTDALLAWRTNPLARRIVGLTTDYVVGDGITLDSTYRPLADFITRFWEHPRNLLALQLPDMCEELTRNGELFPTLHSDATGMTYVRFIPAARIDQIRWTPGDYRTETEYHETLLGNLEGTWWPSPAHPNAARTNARALHYAVNRPIGCTRGDSDLSPILIWLRRYSGWLEDRARLNWAARVFLWFVTVPTSQIEAKKAQYRTTPEPGSIIVKDAGETWEMQTPNIQAHDVSADGRQMRYMIGAGAGVPLHMLGEGGGTNLATAQAMQGPTERQYRRRQLYFCYILKDLACHAYNHWIAHNDRHLRTATTSMINATVPEISREDNQALATAGREIVAMLSQLRGELRAAGIEPTAELNQRTIELAFRFAGEVLTGDEITAILAAPAATSVEQNSGLRATEVAPTSNPSNSSNSSDPSAPVLTEVPAHAA